MGFGSKVAPESLSEISPRKKKIGQRCMAKLTSTHCGACLLWSVIECGASRNTAFYVKTYPIAIIILFVMVPHGSQATLASLYLNLILSFKCLV